MDKPDRLFREYSVTKADTACDSVKIRRIYRA